MVIFLKAMVTILIGNSANFQRFVPIFMIKDMSSLSIVVNLLCLFKRNKSFY